MIELLAVPAWDQPSIPLKRWVEELERQGLAVNVVRESAEASWVEVNSLRLRGYAVMDGLAVEAVNFELAAPDPAPARQAVETAAAALSWEIDDDADENETEDDHE